MQRSRRHRILGSSDLWVVRSAISRINSHEIGTNDLSLEGQRWRVLKGSCLAVASILLDLACRYTVIGHIDSTKIFNAGYYTPFLTFFVDSIGFECCLMHIFVALCRT